MQLPLVPAAGGSSAGPRARCPTRQPCKDGEYKTLSVASGDVGPKPPKWPLPMATGDWFTTTFVPCTKQQSRHGECWWRTKKAGADPKKHPAAYECDRKARSTKNKVFGAAKTAANHVARSGRRDAQKRRSAKLRSTARRRPS